jgi:serine/threonine protein kinase
MALESGKTIGKYRIIERLGRGGMADVYKAHQAALDRYVAVKVLHSFLAEDPDFIGRFEREAQAVAKLRHSNIVQVIDFDHEGDSYYMVMEFIDGPTLKTELRERSRMGQPFDPKEAARILTAIGNAVDYAHRRGMVHRDLKPSNIMFTAEGQPVLTDFGIAKMVGAKRYTVTGAVSGTPVYMSPEQGQGQFGDERSDIYSLGVILYEMVTGQVPFDADTPFAIIMKHINDPLPLPRHVYPQLSESIERVVLRALSKNPDDRYQTAGEMARALQQALVAPAVPIVSAEEVARPSDTLTVSPSRARVPIVPAEPAVRPQPEVEAEQIVGPPLAFPSVALLVVKGEDVGSEYLLETDSMVIGRAGECDVTIRDEAASRQHARLSREGDHFNILDLESANGTFVKGERISDPEPLRDRDQIQIGETVLEFRELIGPAELSWQGKPDRLVAMQNAWQGAVRSLHDDAAFRSHAAAILANMGDSLGFRVQSQGEKRRQLVSFLIDAPTLGQLKISRFPAIFLQRELVTRRDVEDLRDLTDDLGASNRFGLFIALQDPQKTRSLFDETLRPMCEFVVLGQEDVARIVRMRDHRRVLMESINNQVMDLTVVSPFVTAGPVPENMFFGRESEIRTIVQTIHNNSRAIVGGRRIGKTSTLHKVERLLSRSGNGYQVLYMNCQDVSNYEEFFRSINVDWQPSVPIADFSPISFKEFIIKLKIGGEGPIVVILDETDRILRYDIDNDEKLFKVFRGLSEERHCQFLFSGERILSMQMRDSRSPLFNFCDIMPLRYLERKDAEQLITEPMALMNIELQRPSELIGQILNVSSCHPRMVQYICDQLIQRISREATRIVRLDDLRKVTTSSAFYSEYIETIWAQTSPLERLITLIMIQRQDQADSEMSAPDQTAMIIEGLTPTEIRQELGDLGIELKARQVNLALDNLQLYAIVERKAKWYRFIPQAFPRFLKEVKDIPETVELLVEQIEDEAIV